KLSRRDSQPKMVSRRARTLRSARAATPVYEVGDWPVSLAFFVSGLAGLVFEVVWFHRSGLVFGNSIWSTSIVLSSFMGGLALGNAVVGRFGARAGTLRIYAALEMVVAVSGIALTYALPALAPAIAARVDPAAPLWVVNLIRLATAFSMLLVPSM